ncbi:sigma-70 family RNA polymerase sigma factor [Asanoa siamensis]|nr:sigma-70 family RNA polymerase sigma factor [Asanoa siamensis]
MSEFLTLIEKEHARAVLAYAASLTGDRAGAEDVLQETVVRAWRHRDKLAAGQGSLRGWLLTVARNLVVDDVRRSRGTQPVASLPAARCDHAESVVDAVAVATAMRRLPPAHREVLYHVYWQDRSVAETAAALGVAEGTVKSRSHYALRALRRELL